MDSSLRKGGATGVPTSDCARNDNQKHFFNKLLSLIHDIWQSFKAE